MNYIEYKVIALVTAFLLALAWSWLPWVAYNAFVLITGILSPVEHVGYYLITLVCAGGFMAIVENQNPFITTTLDN